MLTYLAGGPAIAALTGVVVLAWRAVDRPRSVPVGAVVRLGPVSHAAHPWNRHHLARWLPQGPWPALRPTLLRAVVSTGLVGRPALRRREEHRATVPG